MVCTTTHIRNNFIQRLKILLTRLWHSKRLTGGKCHIIGWQALPVIDINGFVKPLLHIKIRLRNDFKFDLYHVQGKCNRQQFDDFLSENRVWHFMQTVSLGVNLPEMSNPVYWNKLEKKNQNIVCCFFFLDCAIGICNYYLCKHLMEFCRGESYLSYQSP